MTTLHPDLGTQAVALLKRTASAHQRIASKEVLARADRDGAIRWAAQQGLGIREIARIVDLDPSLVSRIVRPR